MESLASDLVHDSSLVLTKRAPLHGFYEWLEAHAPMLAPNHGVGIFASVAILVLVAVVAAQPGILESFQPSRFGNAPFGWTWILLGLGAYQFVLIGWLNYDQTLAENEQARARYEQGLGRDEQRRGSEAHSLAQKLQRAMLAMVLENQAAARETLPTAALSVRFRDSAKFIQVAAESVRAPEIEQTSTDFLDFADEAIRATLDAILALVRDYDRTVRPAEAATAIYSANLMLYHSVPQTTEEIRRKLEPFLSCTEPGVSLDRLSGLLELKTEWSASTASPDGEDKRDAALRGFVLPAVAWKDREVLHGLPGGPRAWQVGGDFLRYQDVAELHDLVIHDASGTAEVATAVARHFRRPEVAHVKSFISTALISAADDTPDGLVTSASPPIGVININCSKTHILGDSRQVVILAPFLRALLYPLNGLVAYRISAGVKRQTKA